MEKNDDNSFNKALNLAYFYLKFRPRTRWELINYLKKKSLKYKFSQDVVDNVILRLEEQNLINDQEFVKWFVDQRTRSKPSSKLLLRNKLYNLGIERNIIDDFFVESELDEGKLAGEALKKREKYFLQFSREKSFKKALSFLLRRGFSYSISKQAVKEIFSP